MGDATLYSALMFAALINQKGLTNASRWTPPLLAFIEPTAWLGVRVELGTGTSQI
jgi:hypothetical protein